jgi:hypothetical protein
MLLASTAVVFRFLIFSFVQNRKHDRHDVHPRGGKEFEKPATSYYFLLSGELEDTEKCFHVFFGRQHEMQHAHPVCCADQGARNGLFHADKYSPIFGVPAKGRKYSGGVLSICSTFLLGRNASVITIFFDNDSVEAVHKHCLTVTFSTQMWGFESRFENEVKAACPVTYYGW